MVMSRYVFFDNAQSYSIVEETLYGSAFNFAPGTYMSELIDHYRHVHGLHGNGAESPPYHQKA